MLNLHPVNTATKANNLLFVGVQAIQQLDIQNHLHDLNINCLFCNTPKEAMKLLQAQSKNHFQAFIIDQDLLNHVDFNHFYNHCIQPAHHTIPMILQINHSNNYKVVKQALESDVYFSINYPYNSTQFNTVLMAANHSITQHLEVPHCLPNFEKVRSLIQNAVFHVKTVQDAQTLAAILAFTTTDHKRVSIGLFELMLNSIEHGNLGIGYAQKSVLTIKTALPQEIQRRLKLPKNQQKYVTVSVQRFTNKMQFTIKDCGNGFDYENYLNYSENRAMDHHGRGIMIANQLSFDHIEYKDNGSKVVCTVNI